MAVFDINFPSYSRGRMTNILVMIPDVEMKPSEELMSTLKMDPNDFTTVLDYVPYSRRYLYADHRPKGKYPVLYLLHGGGADRNYWRYRTKVQEYVQKYKIAVVCPDGEDAEWHLNRDLEFISRELHEFICGMFPVSDRPQDTYIAGHSRGCGGAMEHVLYFPETYRAAGLIASSFTYYESDLTSLVHQFSEEGKTLPALFMITGDQDHGLSHFRYFRDLLHASSACPQEFSYQEIPGVGHDAEECDTGIRTFLEWIQNKRTDYYSNREEQ